MVDILAKRLINEGILAISYHSKLKKKDKEKALSVAKSKLCTAICSAQALNAGYNVPDINRSICISSTGTELTFIQELGRSTRLNDDGSEKTSLFFNLYSNSTQELNWVNNKTKNILTHDLSLSAALKL
jgi:superfamily II DNA or RNA helicase